MDPGLVGDAHLLAHPFLVKTLILWIPETVLLWYVGMLAVVAEVTPVLTRVVLVGAMLVLGST